MSERRRRSLRSFYCEEDLWEALDAKSREQDVSLDDAINNAVRAWLQGAPQDEAPPRPAFSAEIRRPEAGPVAIEHKTMERMPAVRPPSPPRAPQVTPPPPPQVSATDPNRMPALYLNFEGRSYLIDKSEFVIGRSTQGTDLTIKDGNISRRHVAVVFEGGGFFVKDLGSINGIEFNGERIQERQIHHGDIFHVCDHEISFAYG